MLMVHFQKKYLEQKISCFIDSVFFVCMNSKSASGGNLIASEYSYPVACLLVPVHVEKCLISPYSPAPNTFLRM